MKRAIGYPMLLLPALVVPSFAQMFSTGAATSKVRHTIVAASGGTAPVGGNYSLLSFLNATLNARHGVAFDAFVTGPPPTPGVFVREGNRTSAIALGVNPDPTAPSFGFVSSPVITRNGDVVFDVNFSDVFRSDGKKIVPLLRLGDPAPDGGTVTSRGQERVVNDHGAIAFVATVSGAAATQAVLRIDGTHATTIARNDIAPPTGGRFTSLLGLDMNDLGQVAFKSEMTGGSADQGIFRGEGGHLTPVFVANQITSGGEMFEDFSAPTINAHGQVAAICLLKNSASRVGLFLGDGTETVAIALDGRPAPKGGNYRIFTGTARLNDRGEVAFQARLSDAFSGMFRGNRKRTTTLALAGTKAPGTTGTFESFGDVFELGIDGRVAFTAKLATGMGGVDSSNNTGIWMGTSDEDLQLLVRTGAVIGGNVLTDLRFAGASAGGHPLAVDEDSVLWRGSFGPVNALVVSRILGDHEAAHNEN
ncbi:choice-of-anchor tandem repeat NxxGxxAF-containing protein [uncultured Paludibaculum sp.]|uniref:DUF7453 family protein n=1 Tax=uncultured Paludibaculum sp. TaxID=1765020 RepID=UPI002AAAF3C2|nr:choice-of-anchor tandem repeat NxxGxxAF-containing protein [uncultured Paludibaculum sp.]